MTEIIDSLGNKIEVGDLVLGATDPCSLTLYIVTGVIVPPTDQLRINEPDFIDIVLTTLGIRFLGARCFLARYKRSIYNYRFKRGFVKIDDVTKTNTYKWLVIHHSELAEEYLNRINELRETARLDTANSAGIRD